MRCDLVCVSTPLTIDGKPDYTNIFGAVQSIADKIRSGQLIIIESTLIPGATKAEIVPRLEKCSLKAGKDFFVTYFPERIDPGNKVYGLQSIPKVIAEVTEKCRDLAGFFTGS